MPEAPKVPDQAPADIVREIESIVLARSEGDSIPPTRVLAEQFGVSRPVIRDAIAVLAGRGLVSRQQGREAIVTSPSARELGPLLRSHILFDDVSLLELHEFREVLEVGAARLASIHADRRGVAEISDALHSMKASVTDDELLACDIAFHRAVARSANPLMCLILDSLAPSLQESRLRVWSLATAEAADHERVVELHRAIRDAIAEGDPDAAASAMRKDLQATRELLEAGVRSPTSSR